METVDRRWDSKETHSRPKEGLQDAGNIFKENGIILVIFIKENKTDLND